MWIPGEIQPPIFFFELIRKKKKNNETEKGTVLLENQIRNIKEKRAAL